MSNKKLVRKVSFTYLYKLTAAVSLVAFVVIIAGGVMGGARTSTIVIRSSLAIIVIGIVSRVVLKILSTYEEIHGGKA